ncbi:MAG TPA: Asp-tRNA(Asn)/Glu-tRNA(Gln) amidotransferase subunit GatB [Anaerolineales bacterium]|nr:Asp-tRNA(Asn)/Glu-tRNA(Gln) amidotransferase subunit GatB [Anaerolineales bacterium]HRQ92566.1 Asp-tRNA(Asn)/Glu-tRNA(Gln) amidotransferase subunit GatB [Anaerolineales bacterium]
MSSKYQPVIGLEVHAVLETRSKMFCACPVVDSTIGEPNIAVCPVCSGMPGMLPVINEAAVEYAVRVALALNCTINLTSIFARKSYFYPDLPKGFQISQYEQPLAQNGWLTIETSQGQQRVAIRRVHIEEDTGKLTHVEKSGQRYSLVDLNRSGVPLLEIVTEPELHSVEAVRNCAYALRSILRYVGVNSGNLEKGLMRIEPNISIRPLGSTEFGTRAEIKNLNSFRSLERATTYELARQEQLVESGGSVVQQTMGWDDARGTTLAQRSKEVAEDYRYFPEPDLPPLVLEKAWIEKIRKALPELPHARRERFVAKFGLKTYDADVIVAEREVADFYEAAVAAAKVADAKLIANWLTGALFGLMNEAGSEIGELRFGAKQFAALCDQIAGGKVNPGGAREVLGVLFAEGGAPASIIKARGLQQISNAGQLSAWVSEVIAANPQQVAGYLAGNAPLLNFLFGQVMQKAGGKANPAAVRQELQAQLSKLA